MFRELDTINDVLINHFEIAEHDNVVVTKSNSLILNDFQAHTMFAREIAFVPNKVRVVGGRKIFLSDGDRNLVIYHYDEKNKFSRHCHISGYSFLDICQIKGYGYFQNFVSYNPLKIETGLFDIYNNQLIWKKSVVGTGSFIEGLLFRRPDAKSIELLDLSDGNVIWKYEVSSFPPFYETGKNVETRIGKIVGKLGNDFFIGLTNGKVVVLDFESGKEKTVISNLQFFWHPDNPDVFPDSSAMEVVPDKKKVVGMKGKYYWEIERNTYKVNFYNLSSSFDPAKIQCTSGNLDKAGKIVVDENHVYFIDKENSKVGVFEMENQALVWQYEIPKIEGKWVIPMEIKNRGNLMCVLDNQKRLHVFAKA